MVDTPGGAGGVYTIDEFEEYDLMGNNSDEEDQHAPVREGFSGTKSICREDNSGGIEEARDIVPKPTVKAIQAENNISCGGDDIASVIENTTPKKSAELMAAAKALAVAMDTAAKASAVASDAAEKARAAADAAEKANVAVSRATSALGIARNALAAVELEERRRSNSTTEAERRKPPTITAGVEVETGCEAAVSSSKGAEVAESTVEGKEAANVTREVEAPATSSAGEISVVEPIAKRAVKEAAKPSQATAQGTNQRTHRPRGGNLGVQCYRCGTTRQGHQSVRNPQRNPGSRKRRRGDARSQRSATLLDWSVAPDSVWLCTACFSGVTGLGVSNHETNAASAATTAQRTTTLAKARVRRSGGSSTMGVDTYRGRLGESFQANLPEVGTVEPEDMQGIFQQIWDPIYSFTSDPVAPVADLELLVADFDGVVSKDKCLEILHRYKGHHKSARGYLNNLRELRESLTGTTARGHTRTARMIVSEAARTRTCSGGEGGNELNKSLAAAAPALRRQVEGGINLSTRSTYGMQADLNLSRVFSQQDEDRFVSALLSAVKDYSMPLANVFSRVQQDSFPDRQLSEVMDFYRVWKKIKTPAYEGFKKIRRLREATCAVCHKEIVTASQLAVCATRGCSAVIHLECGKKNETTTRTNKRERSTSTASREEEELFCCESCWELEKSAGDSSSITMSTVAPPAASSPLSVPPPIERNQTCTSTGAGNESNGRSPVEARHTVSPTRIFQLSQNWSSDRREDEQALGGGHFVHDTRVQLWSRCAPGGRSESNLGDGNRDEDGRGVGTRNEGKDDTEGDVERNREDGDPRGNGDDPEADREGDSDEQTETDTEREGSEEEVEEVEGEHGGQTGTATEREDSREETETETEKEVVGEGFQNGTMSSDDY